MNIDNIPTWLTSAWLMLLPGGATLRGVVGVEDNPEAIANRIMDDQVYLQLNDLPSQQLADFLESLQPVGEADTRQIGPVEITRYESRGLLPSPYTDTALPKGYYHAIDKNSGLEIIWSALALQGMRLHDFYGGIGSVFRIEPADVLKLINIVKSN